MKMKEIISLMKIGGRMSRYEDPISINDLISKGDNNQGGCQDVRFIQ